MNEATMTRSERRRRREQLRRRQILRTSVVFFSGFIAAAIVLSVHAAPENPGAVTTATPNSSVLTTDGATIEQLVVASGSKVADKPSYYRPAQDITAAEALAKMAWGEARGCSVTEQAAAMWCVLNRVDSDNAYFPDNVVAVVSQESQFHGYHPENPVTTELLALAEDVLYRWSIEDTCVGDVGRVLPKDYIYFWGDGETNHFTTEFGGGLTWDWSLESPYEG